MTRLVTPPTSPKTRRRQLSRQSRPADMSLEEWQIELRRQFGRQQSFQLKNLGDYPIFSEFQVANPQSKAFTASSFAAKSRRQLLLLGGDFATNHLGTW
ncbi:MAG: hypothetical protein U0793_28040 [Gemmataceae bacterium]